MHLRLLLAFLLLGTCLNAQSTGHRITVDIDGYQEDILTLGHYLLDNQYIIDTARREASGSFVFSSDTAALPGGMYLVVLAPDNEFFQIVIGEEDQEFGLKTSIDSLAKVAVSGSEENRLFFDYLDYLAFKQQQSTPLRASLADTTLAPASTAQAREAMKALDQEVKAHQAELIAAYPDAFVSAIIKANRPILPPDYPELTDPEEKRNAQWHYLQAHYFDNIDLADARLLRTPFLFERIDYFINTLQIKHPDTLAKAIDRVLDAFAPDSDAMKFYTVHYTNEAATSNIVGMDGLYVHMVDTYYRTGKAYWSTEEQLEKMVETAESLRPLLIGQLAPDLNMVTRQGEPITLYGVDADYTVLYFWRYDCPACKKSTPHMKEVFEAWKDRGVKIFSVCTKGEDELGKCWEYVDENGIGDWMQVADPYQRYYQEYDIKSTPSIFLLDKDKRIVSKRISAEQLDEVLTALTEESTRQGK